MSSIKRFWLTLRSLKCCWVISLVRICHFGEVEKAALEKVPPLNAEYRLLAIRSVGCLSADKAIVRVLTSVKKETWLESQKETRNREGC
jgi:hypothetical protein